jgi:hypothetical protein
VDAAGDRPLDSPSDGAAPETLVEVTADLPSESTSTDSQDAAGPLDATPEAGPDAVTDSAQEVPLAFGCPILREPVDRPGSPPGADTYEGFARGFFEAWCLRCHHSTRVTPEARMGAPEEFNWDQRASVMTHLARIRSAVGVENYMPITEPRPSCADRRRLVRWIDLGAP